ncbi:uncharacterized protein [Amphiura filiformis]|uniref:uncharacterized protein n=1 Tax=Amphiura filiformis TaxID=82378 RepID=UPI003B21A268
MANVPTLRQGASPLTVTLFSDFVQHPPREYFEVREGPGHPIYLHNRQKINMCTHSPKRKDYFPDSMGSEMKVNTLAELESLAARLLKNPIFFDVILERDSHKPYDRHRYITKGEFVVTVWTQHPAIRSQLQTLFEKAKEDLRAGRNFAIEINFTSAIKDWLKTLFVEDDAANSGCYIYSMYDCKYARLCVTNYSEFMDCYGCNKEGLILWLICLPCCLLSCPCYRAHRCFTVVDHGGDIQASVGYQHLDPNQSSDAPTIMVLIERMRRETEAASNTQYVTTEPQYAPTGITQQPAAHQHWVQGGVPPETTRYPIGTQIPPPQPVHNIHPSHLPPSYEQSMKDPTSDEANLI